ncbi:antitoxin [Streptomyces jeddahensis]|uniref:Antitoxin n=1 Tax=Streptomyces jeddahensis TaxID=1716141 RepID=A0A177HRY0_9ACTN|nr:antitoxin [Streptomyces jeddahensis]OAH12918.1 antitoxin [Streptomyces jeddahensis]
MSMMDKIKQMLKGRESQTDRAIDKGGDFIDDRTQGKYRGQVDTAQDRLKDEFGRGREQEPPQR